jgi:hypothetical protein
LIDPSERLAEIAAGRDLPGAKGAYWRFAPIADPAKAFGWIADERVRGTPSAVRAPPALLPGRAIIGSQRKNVGWAHWRNHLRSRAFR